MTLTTHLLTGVVDEEGDLESDGCQFGPRLRLDQKESMCFAEVSLTTGDVSSEIFGLTSSLYVRHVPQMEFCFSDVLSPKAGNSCYRFCSIAFYLKTSHRFHLNMVGS